MKIGTRLKAGMVVQIRVPPADIMTCIDLVNKAGLYTEGMSLAQVVRAALSGLCSHARKQGHVPTHDGFELDRMITPFIKAQHLKKVGVQRALEQDALQRQANDDPAREMSIAQVMQGRRATDIRPNPLSVDEKARLLEINELIVRAAVEEGKTIDQWGVEHPDLYEEFKALDARI